MPWTRVNDKLAAMDPAAAQAAVTHAVSEASALAGMKRALRPFPQAAQRGAFPRAGVRRRPDGRWHLRIWLDPTLPDPIQGGACETLSEAIELGSMIAQIKRDAA